MRIAWKLLREEKESLHGFDGLVPGESTADEAQLVEIVLGKKEFLAARARFEDIYCRINIVFGNAAIENELHVAGSLELLENRFVRFGVGLDESSGDDSE